MAIKTKCQTEGCIFVTEIKENSINVNIKIPFDLNITKKEAQVLEANIHNVMELVLSKYFIKN